MRRWGQVLLFLTMPLTLADVVVRYLLRKTFAGAPEIAEFLMVFAIFSAWAFHAVSRPQVSVSLLGEKSPKGTQLGLDLSMLRPRLPDRDLEDDHWGPTRKVHKHGPQES